MRNAGGYATVVEPGRATLERDTFTCCHCNSIVYVAPLADPSDMGGVCLLCTSGTRRGLICPRCATAGGCSPFEKRLDAYERRGRLRAACGL